MQMRNNNPPIPYQRNDSESWAGHKSLSRIERESLSRIERESFSWIERESLRRIERESLRRREREEARKQKSFLKEALCVYLINHAVKTCSSRKVGIFMEEVWQLLKVEGTMQC